MKPRTHRSDGAEASPRSMTGRHLAAEFAGRGVATGRSVVFDEATALELIGRAEEGYIAVLGVDQVNIEHLDGYQPMSRRALTDVERIRSWGSARGFIESLSGRGLYFEVTLESRWATWLAKVKYLFRTGAEWSPEERDEGASLQ